MCAQHATDSATYTSHPENCFGNRIGKNSPFSDSAEWRTPGDFPLKVESFEALSRANCSHVTSCLPRSPRAKTSPQDVLVKTRMAGDFRRFLPILLVVPSGRMSWNTRKVLRLAARSSRIPALRRNSRNPAGPRTKAEILLRSHRLPPRGRCFSRNPENFPRVTSHSPF
jgi:hypothetical protein